MEEQGKRKLLEPGWAGMLTLEEIKYIQNELRQDAKLRRQWHIRGKTAHLSTIAKKAFPEDPEAGKNNILRQQKNESYAHRRNRFSGPKSPSHISNQKDKTKD